MRWSGLLLLFPLALPAQVLEVSSSALSEGAEQVAGKRAHMTGEIRYCCPEVRPLFRGRVSVSASA